MLVISDTQSHIDVMAILSSVEDFALCEASSQASAHGEFKPEDWFKPATTDLRRDRE
jgi:hypothetical protein